MNIKALIEKRNDIFAQAQKIIDSACEAGRELTKEEHASFQELTDKVADYNATIAAAKATQFEDEDPAEPLDGINVDLFKDFAHIGTDTRAFMEDVKDFAATVRTVVLGTAATGMSKSGNTSVIPASIADKIVMRVAELSPIYALSTKYTKKGTVAIPFIKTTTDDVTIAYSEEFAQVQSHAPALDTVVLSDYAYTALTKISYELIDSTDLELVSRIIEYIAQKVAGFVNHECIIGTENKSRGLMRSYDSTNMAVTLADKDEMIADDLIKVKLRLPSIHRRDARWLMNPLTLEAIALLKDGQGRYLFDSNSDKLLGYPVDTDENMPAIGTASTTVVFFGDFSGLASKKAAPDKIQVLYERYSDENAIGIKTFGYIDSVVENVQKIMGLKTPAN